MVDLTGQTYLNERFLEPLPVICIRGRMKSIEHVLTGATSRGFRGSVLFQTILKLVGRQLNPCSEFFDAKKNRAQGNDLNLQKETKPPPLYGILIFFFEDARKQLEKFSLDFSSCQPFLSLPSAAKDTC